MTQTSSAAPAKPATSISDASPVAADRLSAGDGKITVAQGVVQKIAGVACREISGVHAMGVSTSRTFGAVRERIPGSSGPNMPRALELRSGRPRQRSTWTSSWSTALASPISAGASSVTSSRRWSG